MEQPIAYLAASWPQRGIEALRELGYQVRPAADPATPLAVAAAGATIVVTGTGTTLDDHTLDQLPTVEIVCTTTAGLARVDVAGCTLRRIPVLCLPDQPDPAAGICAELARIGAGQTPQFCANPQDVLPITPPAYFLEMRHSAEFDEGVRSREPAVS